ncbi:protein disulfide isomerase isoform X2 [Dermatophagoides pteronyssinus]|uniref:Protein disulfide-isomerase n=1 Tax=Dermatophagoides pteronyssinus TaxID=6956 RepID=A0A6P6YDG2_DERPT|nr:protein disulfide-isomerase-like isoform X2 [Dermatophagoides pteronyssinus]
MKYFILAIVLAIVQTTTVHGSVDDIEREDNVLVLTKENFDDAIATPAVLVEFYAPWCVHCKSLAPEYAKAATELAAEKSEILLAKVDATKETDLAENYDVRGYPTLKFFRNGKPTEYNGERTAEGIIKWLKKKTGPPAQDLQTVEDAEKFRDSQEVVVIGYFSDKDSANAKIYLDVAAENDAIPFALITDKSIAESLAITGDNERVVLFKKFDENRNDFDGEYSVENLKLFIAANSLPLAVEFNHDTAKKIFGGEIKSHLLLFISQKDSDYEKKIETYRSAAKEYKGKVLFVILNSDDDEHEKIMEFFGIQKEQVPSMRLIRLEDEMTKFKPESNEFTEQSIKDFVSGVLSGKIKQHLLSQELPEDWDKNPVKILVSDNFDSVAFDKSKDVLVEFYAPWCGHCKNLAPVYEQLGEKYKDNSNVLITKMDATANELEHTKIASYPTFKLYKRDTNEVIEYNGERTLEGISKFIESGGDYGRAAPDSEVVEEEELDKENLKDEL